MPRKVAAAPSHVCPGIRIHAIDIVQPPGIGIPAIPDIDAHDAIVSAALPVKRSAAMPRNAPSEAMLRAIPGSALVVLVVAPPPCLEELEPVLVPAPRGEVEELVGPHQGLDATGVGGVGVVDGAVLEREDTHP